MRGWVAASILAVVGASGAIGAASCGMSCTEVGCIPAISLAVLDAAGDSALKPRGRLILMDREIAFDCEEPSALDYSCRNGAIAFFVSNDEAKAHTRVEVEISSADGAETFSGEVELSSELSKSQPNGEWCPPTCYGRSGQVTLQ